MDKQQILDAMKKVKASKEDRPHYMVVKFNYNNTFILPYKKGLELMSALEGAEKYEENWGNVPLLEQLNGGIEITYLNDSEYTFIKTAKLLKLSLNEVKESLR